MKRMISLFMSCLILLGFTGCGKKSEAAAESRNPAELFEKVWNSYSDDDIFPVMGGDFDSANSNGPAAYNIEENKESFEATFLYTDDMLNEFEGSNATLIHMMNVNTFCAAMVKVKNASAIPELAEKYKNCVQKNMWMCGMPDTLIVISVGDVMVTAYGENGLIQTFKNNTLSADSSAVILVEAPAVG